MHVIDLYVDIDQNIFFYLYNI